MILLWTALALATELAAEAEVVTLPPVAVGTSVPFTVDFTADGAVTVSEIRITNTNGTSFTLGGPAELDLSSGSASLPMVFTPSAPWGLSATVEVISDADCTRPAVVEVRGTGVTPCIAVSPRIIDFGPMIPPDADQELVNLRSCDGQTWEIDSVLADNPRFTFGAPLPITVGPAGVNVSVQFAPTDTNPASTVMTIGDWATLDLVANDCDTGDPALWDSNGDGTSDCGIPLGGYWVDGDGDGYRGADGDCDDTDPAVNPGMDEVDGLTDDNCDGRTDEHLDFDGDGVRIPDDCNDQDAWVNLGEIEVFDGVDNNCDGQIDERLEAASCGDGSEDEGKGCGCASASGSGASGLWLVVLAGLIRRRARADR